MARRTGKNVKGFSNVRSSAARTRATGNRTLNTGMSRGRFLRTAGVGAAAVGAAAAGLGGVAHATSWPNPPGNGEDITQWLKDGFGAGGDVTLPAGTFYVSDRIDVNGFNGTFKGAGKDATIIKPKATFPAKVNDYFGSEQPDMFYFTDPGTMKFCDFSIIVPGGDIGEEWVWHEVEVTAMAALFFIWPSSNGNCDISAENVGFDGGLGTIVGKNAAGGIAVNGDPSPASCSIQNCDFKNIGSTAAQVAFTCDGSITFGGNASKTNTFTDCGNYPIWVINMDNCNVNISHNKITEYHTAGIFVMQNPFQGPIEQPSSLIMTYNDLLSSDIVADGIQVIDVFNLFGMGKRYDAVLSHNTVELPQTDYEMFWLFGVSDAILSNNTVRGVITGIYAGIVIEVCSNITILGNNIETVEGTQMRLDTCQDCLVVGGSNKTNVYDDSGTNNTFVGVNNMGEGIGQDLKQAIEHKKELLEQGKDPKTGEDISLL